MPITNYEELAAKAEKDFFNNKDISKANKECMKRFLDIYDVSPGRRAIFFRSIKPLLTRLKDIKKDMYNREQINKVFADMRKKISPSSCCMVINVSLRFTRWLNDGERPKGFMDIKNDGKKSQKRNLTPHDMVTWEDMEKAISYTISTQIKAILAVQLDGGFRPSEFVDLDYGDVDRVQDFIIVHVKQGKTGSRDVTLWRSVPYLLSWLNIHPTKKKNDPLWVQEDQTGGKTLRYQYKAILNRVKKMFKKANLEKPSDFYNLRHSACTLSKKDNVPQEVAANKFGHSVEYYTGTYGRLSKDDIMERYSKVYGITKQKDEIKQNVKCRCGVILEPGTEICNNCGQPTTVKKALELKTETDKRLEEIERKIAVIERFDKLVSEGKIRL